MPSAVPVVITGVTSHGDPAFVGKTFPSMASAGLWAGYKPTRWYAENGRTNGRGLQIYREIINRRGAKGYFFNRADDSEVQTWLSTRNIFESDPAHTCLPKIKSGPMEEKDVTVVKKQRNGGQQAEFRKGCFQLHGDKCAFCGTTENVEAAHITSQREWDGRNYESNGIPLCKGVCHPAFDSGRLKWNPNTWSLQLVNFPKEGTFVEPHPEARDNVEEAYWHK